MTAGNTRQGSGNELFEAGFTQNPRLAHKSSSKSAKRVRAPCLEARSAIVGARASERVARASESSTCFPCLKSNQVTLFWPVFTWAKNAQNPTEMLAAQADKWCLDDSETSFSLLMYFQTLQYNTIQTLMTLPEEGFSVTIIINLQDNTSKR